MKEPFCDCQVGECPFGHEGRIFDLCKGVADDLPEDKQISYREILTGNREAPTAEQLSEDGEARAEEYIFEQAYWAKRVCIHQGLEVSPERCVSCMGLMQIKSFWCRKHDKKCTNTRRSTKPDVLLCLECPDYEKA